MVNTVRHPSLPDLRLRRTFCVRMCVALFLREAQPTDARTLQQGGDRLARCSATAGLSRQFAAPRESPHLMRPAAGLRPIPSAAAAAALDAQRARGRPGSQGRTPQRAARAHRRCPGRLRARSPSRMRGRIRPRRRAPAPQQSGPPPEARFW